MSRAAGPNACPAQRRRLARGREGRGGESRAAAASARHSGGDWRDSEEEKGRAGVDEGGAGSREIREDWVRSISPSNAGRKRGRGDEGGWVSPSNAAPARRAAGPSACRAGSGATFVGLRSGEWRGGETREEGGRGQPVQCSAGPACIVISRVPPKPEDSGPIKRLSAASKMGRIIRSNWCFHFVCSIIMVQH